MKHEAKYEKGLSKEVLALNYLLLISKTLLTSFTGSADNRKPFD